MMTDNVGENLADKAWRKNNLYTIVNEAGELMQYRQRPVQADYASKRHGLDVILKSRQHGFSTETEIDILDDVLFTPNLQCGIIAHSIADAQTIFHTKIKTPYEQLHKYLRETYCKATKCDAGTLRLTNGSEIRVAVSFRSANIHRLHVSELGKICSKYPSRAEEILTGSFPAVHPQMGGKITVESTAEGAGGAFYDLCMKSQADTIHAEQEGRKLNPLQFKFHFYSWWKDAKNIASTEGISISDELRRYFKELDSKGIGLSEGQMAWYTVKKDGAGGLGKKMKREHPSIVDEAFEQSVDGAVFGEEIEKCRSDGRICFVPYERTQPVYTFWDLGMGHPTCVIFAQFIKDRINIIDYHEEAGRGIIYHCGVVLKKPYIYADENAHYCPHDVSNRSRETGIPLLDTVRSLLGEKKVVRVDRVTQKIDSIMAAQDIFNKCWFNLDTTKRLMSCLNYYRHEWDENRQKYKDDPIDDWAADGADCFQNLGMVYKYLLRINDVNIGYPLPEPAYSGASNYDYDPLNASKL